MTERDARPPPQPELGARALHLGDRVDAGPLGSGVVVRSDPGEVGQLVPVEDWPPLDSVAQIELRGELATTRRTVVPRGYVPTVSGTVVWGALDPCPIDPCRVSP